MANRIILLVSVLLASAALATTSTSAAPAADECLAGPKGQAPAGKHWYYRTNRATQRKCWYLGDAGAAVTAVTPSKRPMSSPPVDVAEERTVQERGLQERSVNAPTANARAELIAEPRREQPAAPAIQPQPGAFQMAPEGATARNAAVASRWPDPTIGFSAATATMVNDSAPALQKNESPTPVLAAAPVETAEQPSAVTDSADNVSFARFATALVLAFLLIVGGAALVSFVLRRLRERNSSRQVSVTSDVMRREEMLPWARVGEANATRRAVPRAPEQKRLADEIEEMEQLLAVAREARAN